MQFFAKHFSELTTRELFEIYKLRVAVFVVEQKCAYQEVDDIDSQAYHLWFEDDEGIQAYLRLIPAGVARQEVSLGRVIAVKRRCGLGTKIVAQGIRIAQEKLQAKEIVIEAQTYVRKMYESLGFVAESEEFLEDGIPHIRMRLKL
ncbi:GNAT family N-acetyltransferase [Parasutterella secunda]|uniref:GNAT family N-acetyltransferase n=1 Tax=Parasutterella secunda TaxID=626947 RepID=A0ABS2GSK8_9BURK|nr:GNAT family N-acetyltransferase [Parasutterella secunda]MBM6928778.1 GNAT family N-acetyltransferase [Parasutterella secunda]